MDGRRKHGCDGVKVEETADSGNSNTSSISFSVSPGPRIHLLQDGLPLVGATCSLQVQHEAK